VSLLLVLNCYSPIGSFEKGSLNSFANFKSLRTFVMANPKAATSPSPYAAELKAELVDFILSKAPVNVTDTERIQFEKDWMASKLLQVGNWTTKPTKEHEDGQNVFNFVTLEPLKVSSNAYKETLAGNLPTMEDFYLMFAVMCHLNEKTTDSDKICMPRQSRLNAIFQELTRPGTTVAPTGYAGDRTAGWTHEVKMDWTFYEVEDSVTGKKSILPGKTGKNNKGHAVALEQAYRIIAEGHIERTTQGIKHLGRDSTWKKIRDTIKSNGIQTQIVKDFVAACPACSRSPKRESRKQGAKTTKNNGGNIGPKTNTKKRSASEFNADENNEYSPLEKQPTKKPRKAKIASPKVQMNVEPEIGPNFENLSQQQAYFHINHQSDQSSVALFDTGYPSQPFGLTHLDPMDQQQTQLYGFNSMQALGDYNYNMPPQFNGQSGKNFTFFNQAQGDNIFDPSNDLTNALTTFLIDELKGIPFDWAIVNWSNFPLNLTAYWEEVGTAIAQYNQTFASLYNVSPDQLKQQWDINQTGKIDPSLLEKPSELFQQAHYEHNTDESEFLNLDETASSRGHHQPQIPKSFQSSNTGHQITNQSFTNGLSFGSEQLFQQEDIPLSQYYPPTDPLLNIDQLVDLDEEWKLVSEVQNP
jgi:hypothetical protein